ncbi:MAG: 50S ribosomal protein L9 [Epulopiscium sp. Nuni2H_MBin003]|nr:MAG: 50S ribosomal protein L9 [Epulopiscium sp. Nuni2H_MBin003]
MKVILTQDVKKLGKKGDVVEVKDGYANNSLIPKGLAMPANAVNLNKNKLDKNAEEKRRQEELENAQNIKNVIHDKKIRIGIKTGEGGRVFGSVTTKEIADSINTSFNVKIDKKKINLQNPIKAIGAITVPIKLHPKVSADIVVETIGE